MKMLEEGDKIPSFETVNQNGEKVTHEDLMGTKTVLYFYPKDNTPGCTAEACDLRDNYKKWQEMGYQIYGVSADSVKKHQNFIEKYDLPFPLLADESKEVIEAFGVWGQKKFMGKEFDGIHRTTFVINSAGVIDKVIKKVKTKDHSNQLFGEL